MAHYTQSLQINTSGKSLSRITSKVEKAVAESGIKTGLCNLFLRHTSARLIIQENADPDVLIDLEKFISKLVPEGAHYTHSTEGPDDMPAHLKSLLTQTHISLSLKDKKIILGTWQGIYLLEHRASSGKREILVHILGEN